MDVFPFCRCGTSAQGDYDTQQQSSDVIISRPRNLDNYLHLTFCYGLICKGLYQHFDC